MTDKLRFVATIPEKRSLHQMGGLLPQLRSRVGRWAIILVTNKRSQASSKASYNNARYKGDGFEFVARHTAPTEWTVFGRFIGENGK